MAKITKRTVDALAATAGAPVLRDGDLKGFGARRNGNGSISYFVEYRAGRGRGFPVRRMVLGKHGALTPEQARDLARKTLARVAAGEDPQAERNKRRSEPTVAEILRDAIRRHWKAKRRPSTAENFAAMIERTLIPQFGARRLSELRRSDIRAWHAAQTHRPRQANLDLAILRKALSLAVDDELIKENPAKGIAPHPEKARDRVPSDDELRRLFQSMESAPVRPQANLLFRLLLLTGCRSSEWRTAKWAWVDWQHAMLRLPDAKAGARNVPLSRSVIGLLSAAPQSGEFVIPSDSGAAPLSRSNVRDAWKAVCDEARINDLRVHDLRHAFATRGARLGATATVLRDALGHKTLAMTSRYVAAQNDPVRSLAESLAAEFHAIGRSDTSDDLPFAQPPRGNGR